MACSLIIWNRASQWLETGRGLVYLTKQGYGQHFRADSRFAPSQWETALLCNDVSHWLGGSLESALQYIAHVLFKGMFLLVDHIRSCKLQTDVRCLYSKLNDI